jgi:CDP-diacylglycerol--glycerol-3-phosphate 3-phosphatidyltransferase
MARRLSQPIPLVLTIPHSMFRHVPNALTGGRLALAAVFFAMLSYYQHGGRGDPLLLNSTDFLDGYLARRWKVEGAFGRVVDPFVDKVLVLGTFIFFAGKNFVIQEEHTAVVKTITGVAPWMVVLILARELLVTSLRGASEASGQNFGADMGGKVKMVVQSATILAILLYVNYFEGTGGDQERYARYCRDGFIWLTILATLLSGLSYTRRGIQLYRGQRANA